MTTWVSMMIGEHVSMMNEIMSMFGKGFLRQLMGIVFDVTMLLTVSAVKPNIRAMVNRGMEQHHM